jgi:hypothetical protein
VSLTDATVERLRFLFGEDTQAEAASLLERECSNNLPLLESAGPAELERFHFAALKVSRGNIERLRSAIELANQDWRDLLLAAGFANSSEAHLWWQPRKRTKPFDDAKA